jgi:hypothetical protein
MACAREAGLTRIRRGDVAVGVHNLVRQRDEVTGSRGSLGMKSPPGSASKIVTLTTSPMLSVIHGGGRENTFEALVLHGVLGSACAVA